VRLDETWALGVGVGKTMDVKNKGQLIREPINTATYSLRFVLRPNFARLDR
jgi:hypothetical protein